MSISRVSNRWLNRVYKSIALLLVLFAVLISSLRLMLPYAQNYRQDVEDYINQSYDSNVSIGSLAMGWHKTGPTLVAKDVQLIDNDVAQLTIQNIDIRLHFWQSMLSQRIITDNFVLSQGTLTLDKQALSAKASDTSKNINNPMPSSNDQAPILEGLADLFYEQIAKFSIRDSKVIVNNGDRQRTFLISELNWLNIDNRHLAKADVIVDGLTSNNIKLSMDVVGNNSKDITGTIYLEGNNLNITPWLDQVLAIENEKTSSSINFSAWLTIESGLAQQLQLAFDDSEISWQYQNVSHNFSFDKGQILLSNLDDLNTLKVDSSALQFRANDQAWQPLSIEVNRNEDDFFAYISHLDLSSLTRLTPLFSGDNKIRDLVNDLAMQGSVNELFFQSKAGEYLLSAEFEDFSNEFSQGIPGIRNSHGSVLFAEQQLVVELQATQGALDFERHFVLPIPYEQLDVNLTVDFNEQGWQLTTQQVNIESKELKLSAEIGVDAPVDGLAKMSLLASISDGHVEYAHHYFPLTSMSESLVSYLKKGLVGGDIEQALVIYHGAFVNFPFEDHSGIFTVDAELANSQFNFDDDWADITGFAANLNFTNNSMMITGRAGSLSGLNVYGVEVGIAELSRDPILTVDIELEKVNPANVTELMLNSSLKDSVGKTLQQLNISEEINGEFSLQLPLDRTDEVVAQGIINFNDNQLDLTSPEMSFSHLNGQLTFNNDLINTRDFTLMWQGLPLAINVKGMDKESYFSTNIEINAEWQQQNWQAHVPELLKGYAQGQLKLKGELALNSHHDGGFSYTFDAKSPLLGLALNIPAPYNKSPTTTSAFSLNVSGGLNSSSIDVTLGDELSFYGMLNYTSNNNDAPNRNDATITSEPESTDVYFSKAHLILGNEKMLLPMDGFHITSALTEADFASWQPFVMDILDSISDENDISQLASNSSEGLAENISKETKETKETKARKSLLEKPDRIRGSIGKLNILGQTLTDVSFNVLDQNQWWLLQLNAKEARTEIKFFPSWLEQGIEVNADFLHLSNEVSEDEQPKALVSQVEQTTLDKTFFNSVPPMRFSCDSCSVGLADFGKLSFELLRKNSDKIELVNFSAGRNKSYLSLNGYWQFINNEMNGENEGVISKTFLLGQLSANDIEFEMEKLGFASSIKESGAALDFSFDWLGGPQDFLVSELNGNIKVKLDDGVLADVKDRARVASILSLGSLARKLKLDFRDIFSEGMFYSNITGDFHIKHGVIYTENTKMKGAAGDLTIKGNTDLTAGLLDYRMNYKPNLTSSLPTIAWIATLNPVVFLTGLAINEIITATVIYEVVFEVTGDVDEPVVREVNRKNQDVSVGSSSPPKFIDKNETPNKENEPKIETFKDIKKSTQSGELDG